MTAQLIVPIVLAAVLGGLVGYLVRWLYVAQRAGSREQELKHRLEAAQEKAVSIVVEAQEKSADILADLKKEERARQTTLTALEARLLERQESLDKKLADFEVQITTLRAREAAIGEQETKIAAAQEAMQKELEKLSGLSTEEARRELIRRVEENHRQELALVVRRLMQERQTEVERRMSEIITESIQSYARSHVAEITTTIFHLADEELKGKIIGREGRNIRALERATGVEFVIDEMPDSIVISSFDPFRREVARLALEKLIKDGRIQPAKIEEKVEEARQELNKRILEIGEAAALEVGVYDLPKEILELLGRLHFRTSFGQNVLTHSLEMTHIAGILASELGLDVPVAKKGALLHDIGKAIDHEVEGTHVDLGRQILKKYGLDERVIQAMQSHHDDYPYAIPEAFIVATADILSAARPGARRGTLENYIKRLADLERIAGEFPGVKNSFAISAGRELRVFVVPEKVDDFGALELARQIANRVQSELHYPGEIKINVIRETRAVEYAR